MPPSLDVTQKAFEPDGRILIRKRMELRTFVLGKRFAVVRHGLLTSTRVTKKQKQKKIWYETRRVVYSAEGKKSPQHQAVCQAYLDAPLMSDTARPDPPIPYESEPPGVLSQDRRILFSWNVIQMSCKKKKKKRPHHSHEPALERRRLERISQVSRHEAHRIEGPQKGTPKSEEEFSKKS